MPAAFLLFQNYSHKIGNYAGTLGAAVLHCLTTTSILSAAWGARQSNIIPSGHVRLQQRVIC